MIRNLLIATLLTAAVGVSAPAAAATYNIDASHSSALFRVQHFGASNFWGAFHAVTGVVQFDAKAPARMSLNVSVATRSLFTADKKRDQHLKGPDFFDVKRYPAMTFKSTSVKKTRNGLAITGKLSMRGVTKTVTATAQYVGTGKDPWGNTRAGWEARLTIKRADFGMKYMLGGLGNKVDLIIALEGIEKKAKAKK